MRLVVYCMLLANVLFAAWASWIDLPSAAPVAAETAAVTGLQLARGASAAAPAPVHCMTLGPFADAAHATLAAAALTSRGFGSTLRKVERKVGDGFAVYVAGLKSMMARQLALQKLREAGIRDAVDASDGPYTDRIAVGAFADRAVAAQRAAAVRAAIAMSPIIEERRRTLTDQWLDIAISENATLPDVSDLLTEIAEGASKPLVNWNECVKQDASG